MESLSRQIYSFDRFRFDADRLALYYDDTFVKKVEKRTLQVLAVLLSSPGQPVTYEEIITFVWADNRHGATSPRVNQYVSRLRKVLATYEPAVEYIETLPGRGYSFTQEVSRIVSSEAILELDEKAEPAASPTLTGRHRRASAGVAIILLFVVAAAGYWKYGGSDDVERVKSVVKESQMFESLIIYRDPSEFNEEMLDRYWISESDGQMNFDRSRIRQSVKKLLAEGRHYGQATECLTFEFEKVEVNAKQDMATVRTFEKWMIEDNSVEGSASKTRTVGPYFVDYVVRKLNGQWLIERSTTARTVRPIPRLKSFEVTSNENGGWTANITGIDIEPLTVFIEIRGPNCPATRPCRIENLTLRESSPISADSIIDVPLQLPAGEYQVTLRNADSAASNLMSFTIP
jgi:DNA-binding winged helix-turn-helix (wHTH) protein